VNVEGQLTENVDGDDDINEVDNNSNEHKNLSDLPNLEHPSVDEEHPFIVNIFNLHHVNLVRQV
jgi:hypothetical protein